jgi:arylsulfatase A-like enzyme
MRHADGLLKHTWLILIADHGEMLGEHDSYVHGNTLYQPVVRVPLLVSSPSRGRSVVDFPVSLIDLGPTILDLAGVEAPGSFRGRSLGKAVEGGMVPPRPVVSELFQIKRGPNLMQRHLLLAVTDRATNILVRVDGKLERFNLTEDPQELDPLPADSKELDEFLAEAGMRFDLSQALSAPSPDISPEMREQLKTLGYVQ